MNFTKDGGSMSKQGTKLPLYPAGSNGRLRVLILPLSYGKKPKVNLVAKPSRSNLFMTYLAKDTMQGWYKRLGHMGVNTLKKILDCQEIEISDKGDITFKMEDC
jgi:hypothetical protein